jgi:two-component system, response regulator PdtaR
VHLAWVGALTPYLRRRAGHVACPCTGRNDVGTRLARVSTSDAQPESGTNDEVGQDETAPAPPEGDAPATSRSSAEDRRSRRAIVVEDEALIRMDVVETLRDAGFDIVGEAGDGETAVRLAVELRPDIVVMDVKMPVMDGITAAERIGKEHAAPVVLLTAFSQKELVERARDAGAMAYVIKPFTPADLLPAVEIAMSRYTQITALEAEVADLAERFETRKRVDRAKGLLQTKMGLSEPDAFRWIQKTSMDRRLTMREVADAVIEQVGSA